MLYRIDRGAFNNLKLWNYSVRVRQHDLHHSAGLSIDDVGGAQVLQIVFVILLNWMQNLKLSLLRSPHALTGSPSAAEIHHIYRH